MIQNYQRIQRNRFHLRNLLPHLYQMTHWIQHYHCYRPNQNYRLNH